MSGSATPIKQPIQSTALGVVDTGFMTSTADGSTTSTSPVHSGFWSFYKERHVTFYGVSGEGYSLNTDKLD